MVVVNADTPYAYQKLLEHTPSQADPMFVFFVFFGSRFQGGPLLFFGIGTLHGRYMYIMYIYIYLMLLQCYFWIIHIIILLL